MCFQNGQCHPPSSDESAPLPRIAVGTVQNDANRNLMMWGLLDALERSGRQVQSFLSQARFSPHNGVIPTTGQSQRHLDSWLMRPDACREIFYHGARLGDLAVVEGAYDSALGGAKTDGGSLDTLCDWLQLARLVVLDVCQLDYCGLQKPLHTDGLLLDRVPSDYEACRLKTNLEAVWGVPVLGALGELPRLRTVAANLPGGVDPSPELCRALGEELAGSLNVDRLEKIAGERRFPAVAGDLFRKRELKRSPVVAVAYDEAFNCYFPDTLDLLEMRGAHIRVFSPLRSETLPAGTDLVYLGCGRVDRYARTLAANHCLKQSLRTYAGFGGRIYAEGGGLAYLCRNMVLNDQREYSMAGVLPAIAHLAQQAAPARPIEVGMSSGSWLAEESALLRGYLNSRWRIEPQGPLQHYGQDPQGREAFFGLDNVFGTRVHLDFAAQPEFLRGFLQSAATPNLLFLH